jgi:hypothetical protein
MLHHVATGCDDEKPWPRLRDEQFGVDDDCTKPIAEAIESFANCCEVFS